MLKKTFLQEFSTEFWGHLSASQRLAFNKRAGVAKIFGFIGRGVTVMTKETRIIGTCRLFFPQAFLLQLADMQLMFCLVIATGFRSFRHMTSKEMCSCVSASVAGFCQPTTTGQRNYSVSRKS